MRWIEIITLRSATANLQALDTEFLLSIIDNNQTELLKSFRIYRRHKMETDLTVHLFWDSEKVEKKGNTLVQHLIQFMKQYGLVNHSVWVEQSRTKPNLS